MAVDEPLDGPMADEPRKRCESYMFRYYHQLDLAVATRLVPCRVYLSVLAKCELTVSSILLLCRYDVQVLLNRLVTELAENQPEGAFS